MKDKTKWAKGLPDDELAAVVKRWPGTIADLQSGLSAAKFEQRRRNRRAKEDGVAGFSAKRCAGKLDDLEPTSGFAFRIEGTGFRVTRTK